MTLPYSSATSGASAMKDIEKVLRAFGCSKFGTGTDWETGDLYIQFEHQGRQINLKASAKGYAAAWLRENPYSNRMRCTLEEHRQKALQKGEVAVYSVLRDWIKGQVTAVETGVMSFEAAFLSHIMLPSGKSVIEHIQHQKLLPAPEDS
jgi:hypothetical protein